MPTVPLPLKGDSKGFYRIVIMGNSGTGKTTMLRRLSGLLGISSLSLDKILWEPNWVKVPKEVFRARVRTFLDTNSEWIIDGNATTTLGTMISEIATDIIWLDPPFVQYFPRLFWRCIGRIFGFKEQCAPGCNESWRSVFFHRESILLWAITQHRRVRKRNGVWMAADHADYGGKWRRLGGWGQESKVWIQQVEDLVKHK